MTTSTTWPTQIGIRTHRNGRKSLVLGTSADNIVGMDLEKGRALLAELFERAIVPEKVYTP